MARAEAHPGKFGGAAADVEQQRAAAGPGQQRRAAFERELGFLAGRDDVEVDAGFGVHAREEGGAVGGAAAGFRGNGTHCADVAAAQACGAGVQGAHGAFHGLATEGAAVVQALAEPDDARETVDDAKAVIGRGADEEAAIVGAEVQSRERARVAVRHIGCGCGMAHRSVVTFLACHTQCLLGCRQPQAGSAPGYANVSAGWWRGDRDGPGREEVRQGDSAWLDRWLGEPRGGPGMAGMRRLIATWREEDVSR